MSRNWTKTVGEVCFWIGLVLELIIVIIDKSAYTNTLESQRQDRADKVLGQRMAVYFAVRSRHVRIIQDERKG